MNWRETPGVPDYIFAMLYLELGEMDKCMDSLAAVVDSRCPWAPLLLSADGSPPGTARHDADAEMKLPVREF